MELGAFAVQGKELKGCKSDLFDLYSSHNRRIVCFVKPHKTVGSGRGKGRGHFMKHKTKTKALGWLLSLALTLSLLPGMSMPTRAAAGDGAFSAFLGTSSTVALGGFEWYIIDDQSSNDGKSGTVTLLAKDPISTSEFGKSNVYSSSTVKEYLESLVSGTGPFLDVALAIADTDLTDVTPNVTGAKLYLLSEAEAANLPLSIRNCAQANGSLANAWWIRTPGPDEGYEKSIFENTTSGATQVAVNGKLGVRPALRLNLEAVTFEDNEFKLALEYHKVTLSGGANATVAPSNGIKQVCLVDSAISTVTYTANKNCHFEPFDEITTNGITVKRVSETEVTVSGTPTADTDITVPDAVLYESLYGPFVKNATTVKFNNLDWYVIEDNATAENAGTVTLLAKDPIGTSKFGKNNVYSTSTVKEYLEDQITGTGKFVDVVCTIASTDLPDVGVTKAKLYLLSAEEAKALPEEIRKISTDTVYRWLLRTPGTSANNSHLYIYAVHGSDGVVSGVAGYYNEPQWVRPALRLKLSEVKFDSESNTFAVTHKHNFAYSASDDTIILSCVAGGDTDPGFSAKLTINAPSLTIYGQKDDGVSAEARIIDVNSIRGEASVSYYNASKNDEGYTRTGDALTEAPTAAGDYWAEITLGTGDNTATAHVGYTIAKADITPTVSLDGWTYGESANTPVVIGNPGNGAVTYTYKVKGAADSTYTETAPVNAGDYTIKATVAVTDNYNGGEATADYTIAKVPAPTLTAAQKPTADGGTIEIDDTGDYPRVKVLLVKAPEQPLDDYTVMYSLDGESWSAEIPTVSSVGRYKVFVKYDCDANHTPPADDTVYVSTFPSVVFGDESLLGQGNGYIRAPGAGVEYKPEGAAEYTLITGSEEGDDDEEPHMVYRVKNLAAGRYFVRYTASGDYPASVDNIIEISPGRPITARYISEGEVLAELTDLSYGAKLTQPEDPVREGYKFIGWECEGRLWSFDQDVLDSMGSYDFESDEYYYRLEAQWTKKSIVRGVITDEENNPVNGAYVWINDESISTNAEGKYVLAVDNGTYNIVVNGSATRLIEVEGDTEVNIQLNTSKRYFVENRSEFEVLVGGLEEIASGEEVNDGETIEVMLSVFSEEAYNIDASELEEMDPEELQMYEARKAAFETGKSAIKNLEAAKGKTLDFVNLVLEKTVFDDTTYSTSDIGGSNEKLLTIAIPFNMSEKADVAIFRYHDGTASAMNQDPEAGNEGYSVGDGRITIYASGFSTYAIGYTETAKPSSGGGGGGGGATAAAYAVTVNTAQNGTVSANQKTAVSGDKMTITVKPDEGYAVDTVTVTDASGKAVAVTKVNDTTYTFTQPAGKVTVSAAFKAVSGADALAEFDDIDASAWYIDAVRWALENGVMNGVSDHEFNPNGDTTRAMVVTMLWRLEGEAAYVGESEYVDVENTDWYGTAVRWASAEGIVNGYADGKFGPNDPVTREQLAAILHRYAQYRKQDVSVGEDTNILSYDDALTVSEWAVSAIQWACGAGIINGIDGSLAPAGNASRAQVATMLMRYSAAK